MDQIISKLAVLDFSFLLAIGIKLAFMAGLYYTVKKYRPSWMMSVRVIVCIVVLRIVLFENPVAWYIYNSTLNPEVIGWRQSSVLYDNFNQYKSNDDIKFLAVGSSQTGAIYDVSDDSVASMVRVKSLAGFGPVDLFVYRDNIVEADPENVLLFLSEFDMGRYPSLEALKLSPSLGLKFPETFLRIKNDFSGDETDSILKEMFFGELFPEYKYGYIFKGYMDQISGKIEVMPSLESQLNEKEYVENQLNQLQTALQEKNLNINFKYLQDFIVHLNRHDIEVFIIEGQYHPQAYTSKNIDIQEKVRNRLANMERDFSNLTYVPKSETFIFSTDDYVDAYHVNKNAAAKFTRSTIPSLNKFSAE